MPINSFSGNPRVEWLVDAEGADRDMRLLEDFNYTDPDGRVWDAPAGSVINGASIPEALWSLVGSPYTGDYRRASIVHDVACDTPKVNRKEADVMFYYACIAGGCSLFQARVLYAGVRFGAWANIALPFSTTLKATNFLDVKPQASTNRFLRDKLEEVSLSLAELPDDASIEALDAAIAQAFTIPGTSTTVPGGQVNDAGSHIDEAFLAQGLKNLESLSAAEYRKDLTHLLNGSDTQLELAQLGRLGGIAMKEPLATPKSLTEPSPITGAYRSWELLPSSAFEAKSKTWQYQLLDKLGPPSTGSAYATAEIAHHERGFFKLVADVICTKTGEQDGKLREQIDNILAKTGLSKLPFSRDSIIGSVAVQLAKLLVTYIPMLANVGATLLAALVTVLMHWGVNAFCNSYGGNKPEH